MIPRKMRSSESEIGYRHACLVAIFSFAYTLVAQTRRPIMTSSQNRLKNASGVRLVYSGTLDSVGCSAPCIGWKVVGSCRISSVTSIKFEAFLDDLCFAFFIGGWIFKSHLARGFWDHLADIIVRIAKTGLWNRLSVLKAKLSGEEI